MDIRAPDELEQGFGEIVVFVNGAPASGEVLIEGPKGGFRRALDSFGSVDFYFDEPGSWKIVYGNSSKTVLVKKRAEPSPTPAVLSAKGDETGKATGLVAAGQTNWWWLLLAALLLLAAWLLYERWWLAFSLKKTLRNGRVTLMVKNRGGDLTGLEILDVLPEGAHASAFTEAPEERETINGKTLKWRKGFLKKGEPWIVSYSFSGTELKRAQAKARDDKGKEVTAFG